MKLPTNQEVFDRLMLEHPDKYPGLELEEIKIYDSGAVRVRGRFAPGYSGNGKGKKKIKKKSIEQVGSSGITKEDIKRFGKDAKKALEHLLETAGSRQEAKEISKILISYQSPKLANIESVSTEHKKIEVSWAGDTGKLVNITPEEDSVQEEAAKKILGIALEEDISLPEATPEIISTSETKD